MDRQRVELFLILGGIFLFLLGGIVAWLTLPFLNKEQLTIAIAVATFVIVLISFGISLFIYTYIDGPRRLANEIKLIMTANSAHRVKVEGLAGAKRLAETINEFADRLQTIMDNQAEQIQQARADLEEEKNRLVALMSELTEGVLVCNLEGRILLYNNRAKQLFGHAPRSMTITNKVGGFVGLGRSIFGLIDRNAITHALENLIHRRDTQTAPLISQFVATATNGQLIRARMAPVLTQRQRINGFILTLEDVTQQTQASQRRDVLLRSLTEGIRSSLANIRAAIETIEQFPEMEPDKLAQLRQIIQEESLTLTARLNQTTAEYAADLKADWNLEEMLGRDLLWAVQRWLEDKFEVKATILDESENVWLKVDSYSIVHAIAHLARWLKTDFGITEVQICLKETGQLAAFDLAWRDGMTDMDTLWSWQNRPLTTGHEGRQLTLTDVAERHGGEVWCQTDRTTNTAYFRLLLPTTQPKPIERVELGQVSRPEYYDFDLFHQPGQTPELDHQPLSELTYTIFDTETTGLNPSQGDEIISLSAVRIVNGRLLRQEIFDQLIDPRRPVPLSSVQIHGISSELLKDQPTIEQVLPHFFRFAEGTVLVAHNAAFDMRLLQLKEVRTGLKFTNPVLDTLLLSAVIHPDQKDHSLERIAQRLGINIIGRHSSLGDAILTGEVLLKLIPLLAEQGIVTLKDARTAAQQTFQARISY